MLRSIPSSARSFFIFLSLGALAACGSTSTSQTPATDAATDGGCPAGTKVCGDRCVATDDPKFGCGAAQCVACSETNAAAVCTDDRCAVVCKSGFADCDGDAANGCEVDFTRDANHCGRCDRSCQGGACDAGVCGAVVIANERATSLALDADAVYFANYSDGTVHRASKDGTGLSVVASGQHTPRRITVGADTILWSTDDGLMKSPVKSAAPVVLALPSIPGVAIGASVVVGSDVYFSESMFDGGGAIRRIPLVGGSATTVASFGDGSIDAPIAVDDANVYFIRHDTLEARSLQRVSRTDGAVSTIATIGSDASVMVLDAPDLFVLAESDVLRHTIGTNKVGIILSGLTGDDLAVDDTNVFIASTAGVFALPKAGGPMLNVTRDGISLAVDARALFVGTETSIVKLAK